MVIGGFLGFGVEYFLENGMDVGFCIFVGLCFVWFVEVIDGCYVVF